MSIPRSRSRAQRSAFSRSPMVSRSPPKKPAFLLTTWSPSASTLRVRPVPPGHLSARGSTNFVHPNWAGFDIREGLAHKLGKPVSYLNDANAAALWGHYAIFGSNSRETSISSVIGTGNGGGVILEGNVVKGKNGFGGELGHVLIPYQSIAGTSGIKAGMQLRTHRRPGIAVLAHRHRKEHPALFPAALSRSRAGQTGSPPGGQTRARSG